MPAARNQEVTVRRPLAKRRPSSGRGRRLAERWCSQEARAVEALVRKGGRCENGMVGSWTGRGMDDTYLILSREPTFVQLYVSGTSAVSFLCPASRQIFN